MPLLEEELDVSNVPGLTEHIKIADSKLINFYPICNSLKFKLCCPIVSYVDKINISVIRTYDGGLESKKVKEILKNNLDLICS